MTRYGNELTQNMIAEARFEYQRLIPKIPFLGGKQPFTQFIISTAWFLAMHRALKKRGKTVEETGQLIYDISKAFLDNSPGFLRRLLGYMTFSQRYLKRLRKRAVESQQRHYPGDYVFAFVEGDNKTFDYGVDYLECASCKFLSEQGAPELAPYLCAVDEIYSEMLGWGLTRTMTLAEGYSTCDFRFKKGAPTNVADHAVLKRE